MSLDVHLTLGTDDKSVVVEVDRPGLPEQFRARLLHAELELLARGGRPRPRNGRVLGVHLSADESPPNRSVSAKLEEVAEVMVFLASNGSSYVSDAH